MLARDTHTMKHLALVVASLIFVAGCKVAAVAIMASSPGNVVRPVEPSVDVHTFPAGKPMVLAAMGQVRLGVSWDAVCERDSLSSPTLHRSSCYQQTFAVRVACRGVPCKVHGTEKGRSKVYGETGVVVTATRPGTLRIAVTLIRLKDKEQHDFPVGPIEVVSVDQFALECVTTNNPEVVFGLRVNALSQGRPVFGAEPEFFLGNRPIDCDFLSGMVDEKGSEFVCWRPKEKQVEVVARFGDVVAKIRCPPDATTGDKPEDGNQGSREKQRRY